MIKSKTSLCVRMNILSILIGTMILVQVACMILLGRISVDFERDHAQRVTEIYHQQYDVIAHGPVNLLDNASGRMELGPSE